MPRTIPADPETMDELRGDCRQIDAAWTTSSTPPWAVPAPTPSRAPAFDVPERGRTLIEGMSDYGD